MKVDDNRSLNYTSERVVTYLFSFLLSTFIVLIVDRKIPTQNGLLNGNPGRRHHHRTYLLTIDISFGQNHASNRASLT